ncbi:DUF4097 family beta strand repeat-containing protein [Allorhizocola rhizosphaerae]|uniref:DUF4097 family beta strand repeat-containing protein n=1 Tax=Allorhizocola rhizosphaerae TaxID=1872709 RepID=UPI000E3C34B7|nr:DUF4097 family beta strand repeat-containing protein [Allorhizocola rhizosphaerae]
MNYEFASPGPIKADIRIAGGALHVDAAEHDVITVSVEPFDNSTASREAAEQTRVALEGRDLVVHAPHGKGWSLFRWPKLNIRVAIPVDSTLTVKSASADLQCSGNYADAVVHTASGDVRLDRVAKDTSINSASGDVRVGYVGGDLRAHSASGDIEVQHVGKGADVTTASGDIAVGRAERDVRAKTASGDVKVGVAREGEVKVHTASGDVTVGIAAGTGVWLDVSTASGKTTSDLSMTGPEQPQTGAKLTVKVRTASGDISLRRVTA